MSQLLSLKSLINQRHTLFAAVLLFITILVIALNLLFAHSSLIGLVASISYILLNGTLLGRTFFRKENTFFRLVLGTLLFASILGLVSWLTMIAYNLDVTPLIIILVVVATLSIILQQKKTGSKLRLKAKTRTPLKSSKYVIFTDVLYFLTAFLAFYLLFISRKGEVVSVWVALHPAFMPVFFASTFLLVASVIFHQKVEQKLLLVGVYSILSLSIFAVVFPAGDVGGQQHIIGRTRLVYDNVVTHGIGLRTDNPLGQIYLWLRGDHLQSAITVLLARMLYVDVYWTHVSLLPFLWGTFIPIGIFLITKLLSKNENISIISTLLVLAFPYTLAWGTISTYNSLGFIFFLYSVYFILEYLISNESRKHIPLILLFTFLAFLSHFLTGMISFSLLIIATSVKRYREQKSKKLESVASLLVSFIFGASILPLALTYRRFFYPESTYFGLTKLSDLTKEEIVWTFFIGQYVNFDVKYAIMLGIGPVLGVLGLLYYFYVQRQKSDSKMRIYTLFFSLSLLLVLSDYQVLKLFMVNVPFAEERLWVFRDLLLVPFLAILTVNVFDLLHKILSNGKKQLFEATHLNSRSALTYGSIILLLTSWITASIYYAYPHVGPLQTTSYEAEAVIFLRTNSTKPYVVIGDQWIIFAAEMFVGVYNPNEFYFSPVDPRGVRLFLQMKNNTSIETMQEAMEYNNAAIAYFILDKPRLNEEEFDRVYSTALLNGLEIYRSFSYQGEEKLYIFYYRK